MHWISAPLAPDHSYHFSKMQCRLKASPYESPGEQPESEHSKLALQTVLPNKDIDIAEEVTSYTTSLCQARGNEVDPCCDVVAPWQQTHLQASMSTSLFQSTRWEHFQTMPCYTTITYYHYPSPLQPIRPGCSWCLQLPFRSSEPQSKPSGLSAESWHGILMHVVQTKCLDLPLSPIYLPTLLPNYFRHVTLRRNDHRRWSATRGTGTDSRSV